MIPLLLLLSIGIHASWKRGQLEAAWRPLLVTAVGRPGDRGRHRIWRVRWPSCAGDGRYRHRQLDHPVLVAGSCGPAAATPDSAASRARHDPGPYRYGRRGHRTDGRRVLYQRAGYRAVRGGPAPAWAATTSGSWAPSRSKAPNYSSTRATVLVGREGRTITTLYPEVRQFWVQQQTRKVAGIYNLHGTDLFIALGDDLGAGRWSLRAQIRPLITLLWLGPLLMALGRRAGTVPTVAIVWRGPRLAKVCSRSLGKPIESALPGPGSRVRRPGGGAGRWYQSLAPGGCAAVPRWWAARFRTGSCPCSRIRRSPWGSRQLKGQWYVLNYWGAWCYACRVEHPDAAAGTA